MAQAFKHLTMSEFKKLTMNQKLRYIEDATAEMKPENPPALFKPEPAGVNAVKKRREKFSNPNT